MRYDLQVLTGPAIKPVTLAEAKAHLRVLHTSEDALIERLIAVAVSHVENVLSRALITRILKLIIDAFPAKDVAIALPRPPVASVSSVGYLDAAGNVQTLSPPAYVLATSPVDAELSPAPKSSWPITSSVRRAVSVTYAAGYGATPADVPEDIRNAILLLTEHHYYNRGVVTDGRFGITPMGVTALLDPHKTSGWI